MFTRQHYKAIAEIIRYNRAKVAEGKSEDTIEDCIACDIADFFADDNPRFDYTRFYKACGMED